MRESRLNLKSHTVTKTNAKGNHLGAERCTLLTPSSLKSKCPTLNLGDLRGILLARPREAVRSRVRSLTLAEPLFQCSGRLRAGLTWAWQTPADRSGLEISLLLCLSDRLSPPTPTGNHCRLVSVFMIPPRLSHGYLLCLK